MARKLERFYNDRIVTEENLNEAVNILTGLTVLNTDFSTDSGNFGTGTFENSAFSVTRDANGDITGIALDMHEFSNTPLYTTDNLTYSNADIVNPITTSAYTVLDPDGATVDSTTYTLNADGSLTFSSAQTESYFLIKDLEYVKKKSLTVGRDTAGNITTFDIS